MYVAALLTEFHSDTLSIDGGMTRHVMKREIPALVGTTAVSFAVFAALYALVYKLTGNAYYHIVADNKE